MLFVFMLKNEKGHQNWCPYVIEAINCAPHSTLAFIDLFNRAHRKIKYTISII